MTFLTKEQVIELFEDFKIIEFKEIEKDNFTGLGQMKHWHIFNVIAKKVLMINYMEYICPKTNVEGPLALAK